MNKKAKANKEIVEQIRARGIYSYILYALDTMIVTTG